MSDEAWIGVDLDGTLARYDGWEGTEHIGEPIAPMVERVRGWLAEGRTVKIVTARVSERDPMEVSAARVAIYRWCRKHLGRELAITCCKDYMMYELWDDRAVQVVRNTGKWVLEHVLEALAEVGDEDLSDDLLDRLVERGVIDENEDEVEHGDG